MTLTIGSMFSGYGGLDLGVQSVIDSEVLWHCENDKAPSAVLDYHYPHIPNFGDVTKIDWHKMPPVDIITAGYPCQPFSVAGQRKGKKDDRHLWPYVAAALSALRPRYAILENVAGHLTLGLVQVIGELSEMGYDSTWGIVRACDAGAAHQRKRVFIIAHTKRERYDRGRKPEPAQRQESRWPNVERLTDNATDTDNTRRGEQRRTITAQPKQSTIEYSSDDAADTSSERYGRQQNVGMVGRMGSTSAIIDRQESATWEVSSDRSNEIVPVNWGQYTAAIERWEQTLCRPAPNPTEPDKTGRQRLAPKFVEWLMGLPVGHVTNPDIGLARNAQLKMLGNGVVPQQAALALSMLLPLVHNE